VSNSFHNGVFRDEFEDGLRSWNVQDYAERYNSRMRWHLSSKESLSGEQSLSVGHEETDIKDNNDDIHIATAASFVFEKTSILQFSLKKSREINLQVSLFNPDQSMQEKIAHFSGGDNFSEWKLVSFELSKFAGDTPYQIILQVWGQGSLYIDDVQLTDISNKE